ncbi:MAG: DNA mismatch repair endonuclease MutL [Verrucomicrobiales bacterium]
MAKIQVLSDILASQVAAGEVVERPASVVKELVENSIDAGADNIEVRAQRGGIALIRIVDNGCGMSREDALLCLERHATSKIRTADDLGSIRTLGFRGEALPSIASVSRFTLTTRETDAIAGTELTVEGGKVGDVRDSGSAPGTQIEVRTLFYNVPARRKYLRTETTEFSHIEHHLRLQAIAHPEVSFTLLHNDRLVFQLPATTRLIERIEGLIGRETCDHLIELPATDGGANGVGIRGFISEPGFGRSNRSLQLSFLNNRPVESPAINHGLRNGYHGALAKGQHPAAFLFLNLDPAEVDVNVHPAKREVRFLDGNGVQNAITTAVMRGLRNNVRATGARSAPSRVDPAPEPTTAFSETSSENVRAAIAPSVSARPAPSPPPPPSSRPAPEPSPRVHREWITPPTQPELPASPASAPRESPTPPPSREPQAGAAAPEPSRPNFRLVGVLGKAYSVLESDEGLVLMDQRAAHERVLFELALGHHDKDADAPSQGLLIPVMLQLSPKEFDFVRQNIPAIQRLGFGIEEFGSNTIKVDSLPAFCKTTDAQAFLDMVLEGLHQLRSSGSSRLTDEAIATAVCRQAVRQRDSLSEAEIRRLIDDLLACDMPYCCPNGNPTLIQISWSELARKFGKQG